MTALELRDGWLMPAAVIPKQFAQWRGEAVEHIGAALPFLKHGPRVAVQAGANLGIWPKMLIDDYGFHTVIAFEPDETNFKCVQANLEAKLTLGEVVLIRAALGAQPGKARWSRASEHKPGWHKIAPDHCATKFVDGEVDVTTIDLLVPEHADVHFIALDVEGYELPALQGAEQTIARCRPVVLFEDLGRSESESFKKKSGRAYGYDDGSVQRWLAERGYVKVAEVKNDEVWAWKI
jgi:FkbM family methyltransferase